MKAEQRDQEAQEMLDYLEQLQVEDEKVRGPGVGWEGGWLAGRIRVTLEAGLRLKS